MSLRGSLVVAAFPLAAAICGCSSAGPLASTWPPAPCIWCQIVADLGSGRHDGKVVDGDATTRDAGFATLRRTDHLVVDLEALLIGLFAAVRPAPRCNRGPDGSRLGAYFGQLIGRLLLRCDA
jgi:hypothetical protein